MIAFLKKIRLFIFLSCLFSQTCMLSGAPKKIAPQKNSSRAEVSSKEKKNIFKRMSKYPKTLAAGSIGMLAGVALIIYLCLRDSNPPAAAPVLPAAVLPGAAPAPVLPEPGPQPAVPDAGAARPAVRGAAAPVLPAAAPQPAADSPVAAPAPVLPAAARLRPAEPARLASPVLPARGADAPVLPAPAVAREEDPTKTVTDTITVANTCFKLRRILACKPNCDFMKKPYLVASDLRDQMSPPQKLLHTNTCACFALANAIIPKEESRDAYPDVRRNCQVLILAAKIFTFVPNDKMGSMLDIKRLVQYINSQKTHNDLALEIMNFLDTESIGFYSNVPGASTSNNDVNENSYAKELLDRIKNDDESCFADLGKIQKVDDQDGDTSDRGKHLLANITSNYPNFKNGGNDEEIILLLKSQCGFASKVAKENGSALVTVPHKMFNNNSLTKIKQEGKGSIIVHEKDHHFYCVKVVKDSAGVWSMKQHDSIHCNQEQPSTEVKEMIKIFLRA